MSHHLLSPQNDIAFKRIFGTQDKAVLLKMLNAVLVEHLTNPIKEVTFLDPKLGDPEAKLKQSIVDVLCQDQQGGSIHCRDAGGQDLCL